MVVDANNGNVMHAEQADEPRYPASLTKIMTLYMAFEAIEQGRSSYATRIKVSHEAASQPPTRLDLEPGETIALIDAMKALITKSANDAAVAIAEHLGGTEARFARMMTDKARLFGMSRTTFRNASGLPDPGQVTTARDMVRLSLRLQDDFPQHYHLFSLRSFTYDGSSYRNHNNLLYRFQGTDGIKTGYTRASGFNLVSSVRRGGRHVIGVVFGGRTAGRRDDAMQLLVSRALLHSSPYKTRRSAPVLVAAATPVQRPRPAQQPDPVAVPVPADRPRPQQFAAARSIETAPRSDAEADRPRPVLVPPRPRAATPVADASSQWPLQVPEPVPAVRQQMVRAPMPADEPSPRMAFTPRGMDLSAARAPASEPARGAPPSTLQQQAMSLVRGGSTFVPPPASNAAPALQSAFAPEPAPARGAPASTFQQQANNLARGNDAFLPGRSGENRDAFLGRSAENRDAFLLGRSAENRDAVVPSSARTLPPPSAVRGPLPPPAPAGGGFEIQIGAFGSAMEADRALAAARSSSGDLLNGHAARAVPVTKEARQVIRARFAGFDSRSAASTCIELRRRQVDCFVMRAE